MAPNDIDLLKEQLGRIEGKLDRVITRFEVEKAGNSDVDDRISKLSGVARSLTASSMKLSLAKTLPHWGVAVSVGVIAVLMTLAAVASAH